jgi:lysophospholipase L1-like esterase
MRRLTIFKLISISLPLIAIIALEVILRVADYGEDYQLFHRIQLENKPDFLIMNGKMADKYFNDDELKSDNQTDLFLKEKTDNTFRVFVQGASTVVGFPFYRGGSFPRMLKQRLSLTFPDVNIEVVNTGMTAVNSYTLLDLVDEIIEQKPDLVIIYAGHNEYYGAMGVGSTISHGSHPMVVRSYLMLKEFRFFQLCENAYYKIFGSNIQKPSERTTTLMEVMAEKQRIPYQSEAYFAGINQFKANLKKILSKYDRHDIPVMLSTVVSNERDIEPFISEGIADMDQFKKVLNQESHPDPNEIAQYDAKEVYKRGTLYLKNNEATAKEYFHFAKELDLLRFRAPEKINEVIIELSDEYDVSLVDMKAIFEKHSEHGIVGDELMTEHVHPNVFGQFLMADAFYNKIKELNLLSDWTNYIPYNEALQDIPVSLIDSIQGMLVINELKNSWPYNLGGNRLRAGESIDRKNLERIYPELQMAKDIKQNAIRWNDAMSLSYNMYKNDKEYEQALKIAQALIFEYPEQGHVYQMAGDMCMKLENYQRAVFYYARYNQIDNSVESVEKLTVAYLQSNNLSSAEKTLSEAKSQGLNVRSLSELRKEAMVGEEEDY